MLDSFNRNIDYARISVTDRCNLRCTYCMPNGDEYYNTCEEIMSDEDILKICKSFSKIGIKKIKITGGEPLLRKKIIPLIEKIKCIPGIDEVTLTTNGILLDQYLEELKKIDIDGINISIDAVDEMLFENITGFNKVKDVINVINKAEKLGIKNIKLNCVLIKNTNEDQYTKLVNLIKDKHICIKFIEMMPIGIGKEYNPITLNEVKKILENEFGELIIENEKLGNGPAEYYKINGLKCRIGFIGAISHKFCKTCNRIRVTSDGFLKTCLHFNTGINLKQYINKNNLEEIIEATILKKQESHKFEEKSDSCNFEVKYMAQIGG